MNSDRYELKPVRNGLKKLTKCNRCQNGILTPDHAFSCDIIMKINNFSLVTLEKDYRKI